MKRLFGTTLACVTAIASVDAWAAGQLSTQVSANRVAVGQEFTLQLTCMVSGRSGSPSDPRLAVPRGIAAQGPSISTQQNVSIVNGQIQQQSGVVATWVLVASATGRFRVGPASITLNGQRLTDRAVEIEVVARGALPPSRPRRRGLPFDPFDPFGSDPFGGGDPFGGPMLPPGLDLAPSRPHLDEIPSYPSDLNIDKARDPVAFLDARVTSPKVVVGEQITLRIYAYGKPGPFELMLSQEPSRVDFLSYQNEKDNPIGPLYRIKLDSEIWYARKILSYALFPTKSGRLQVGPAEANFAGAGLFAGNAYRNVQRKSQPLEILVEEPPLAGRPPGYHIGDVGSFTLSATVEPRKIKASEAISVQIEVSGTGQLPQRLDPPEQTGVDWLDPTITQQIDDQREQIAGRRQFTYVVRLDRPGRIDLGRFRFPYFDPSTRKYAVASADLGTVEVEPAATANSAQPGSPAAAAAPNAIGTDDPFGAALVPRQRLGDQAENTHYLADKPGFFFWLAAGPLLSLSAIGARAAWRRLAAYRDRRTGSPKALLMRELGIAQKAAAANDASAVAASVERFLHGLIEHSVGLKSRGILRSELPAQIERLGLDAALCQRIVKLLERCDHVRFVQPNAEDARDMVTEAESLFAGLQSNFARTPRRPT